MGAVLASGETRTRQRERMTMVCTPAGLGAALGSVFVFTAQGRSCLCS